MSFGIEMTNVAKIAPSEIFLCMRAANERRRYRVTPSLIGWAHTLWASAAKTSI